jgi:CheY-like chemotaxis protein
MTPPQRILCIDDDVDVLDLLSRLISQSGQADVMTSNSGRQALELLDHWAPDLVLLDFAMPELDGHQTLAEVRRRLPGVPPVVVFLSGMVGTADLIGYKDWGAQGAIRKPVYPDRFLGQIEEIWSAAVCFRSGS